MIRADNFFCNFFAIAVKASSITQLIRNELSLFDLLIENKATNEYLNIDCKTFADVLIQETAKYDLNSIYPNLGERLLGEETNNFTNKLNISIEVKVCENITLTRNLILKILNGHEDLADKLSTIIHKSVSEFYDKNFETLKSLCEKYFCTDNIQIWIDPIDATKDYINGLGLTDQQNISNNVDSIKNATILIGIFDKITGIPSAGVICQPFHHRDSRGLWEHSCFWGIYFDSISLYSDNIQKRTFTNPGKIITSYREMDYFSRNLNNSNQSIEWIVTGKSGAGFKLLSLLTSNSDCCILSKSSTYKWDTCGPHGILIAMGGGLVDYQKVINESLKYMKDFSEFDIVNKIKTLFNTYQVKYFLTDNSACNSGGFIAYTDPDVGVSLVLSLIYKLNNI